MIFERRLAPPSGPRRQPAARDELNRDASLACLGTLVLGLHVASKTTLRRRDVRHNLAFKERLVLWVSVSS